MGRDARLWTLLALLGALLATVDGVAGGNATVLNSTQQVVVLVRGQSQDPFQLTVEIQPPLPSSAILLLQQDPAAKGGSGKRAEVTDPTSNAEQKQEQGHQTSAAAGLARLLSLAAPEVVSFRAQDVLDFVTDGFPSLGGVVGPAAAVELLPLQEEVVLPRCTFGLLRAPQTTACLMAGRPYTLTLVKNSKDTNNNHSIALAAASNISLSGSIGGVSNLREQREQATANSAVAAWDILPEEIGAAAGNTVERFTIDVSYSIAGNCALEPAKVVFDKLLVPSTPSSGSSARFVGLPAASTRFELSGCWQELLSGEEHCVAPCTLYQVTVGTVGSRALAKQSVVVRTGPAVFAAPSVMAPSRFPPPRVDLVLFEVRPTSIWPDTLLGVAVTLTDLYTGQLTFDAAVWSLDGANTVVFVDSLGAYIVVRIAVTPFTSYSGSVSLVSESGQSPPSPLVFSTPPAPPDAPVELTISTPPPPPTAAEGSLLRDGEDADSSLDNVSSSAWQRPRRMAGTPTVRVAWKPPPGRPRGNITSYRLYLGQVHNPDQQLVAEVDGGVVEVTLAASQLTGLDVGLQLRVQALTAAGGGAFSEPAKDTRQAAAPASSTQPSSNPLSRGEVAAIVVGCVVFAVCVLLALLALWRRQRQLRRQGLHVFAFPEPDEWEMDRGQLRVLHKVGSGAFGVVSVATTAKTALARPLAPTPPDGQKSERGPHSTVDRAAPHARSYRYSESSPSADEDTKDEADGDDEEEDEEGQMQSSQAVDVAVKECKVRRDEGLMSFLEELRLMKRLSVPGHDNVVRLLGVCTQAHPLLMVMECCNGGDLRHCLLQNRPRSQAPSRFTWADLIKMGLDVAHGMDYLCGQHKFVHRDLAARNCLVHETDTTLTVKIGDMGKSRDVHYFSLYRRKGDLEMPVRWMSPEALKEGVYSAKSDVWSFGVCLWEVATFANVPYGSTESNDQVAKEVTAGRRLKAPSGTPDGFAAVMLSCFAPSASRPSFAALSHHLEELRGSCSSQQHPEHDAGVSVNTLQLPITYSAAPPIYQQLNAARINASALHLRRAVGGDADDSMSFDVDEVGSGSTNYTPLAAARVDSAPTVVVTQSPTPGNAANDTLATAHRAVNATSQRQPELRPREMELPQQQPGSFVASTRTSPTHLFAASTRASPTHSTEGGSSGRSPSSSRIGSPIVFLVIVAAVLLAGAAVPGRSGSLPYLGPFLNVSAASPAGVMVGFAAGAEPGSFSLHLSPANSSAGRSINVVNEAAVLLRRQLDYLTGELADSLGEVLAASLVDAYLPTSIPLPEAENTPFVLPSCRPTSPPRAPCLVPGQEHDIVLLSDEDSGTLLDTARVTVPTTDFAVRNLTQQDASASSATVTWRLPADVEGNSLVDMRLEIRADAVGNVGLPDAAEAVRRGARLFRAGLLLAADATAFVLQGCFENINTGATQCVTPYTLYEITVVTNGTLYHSRASVLVSTAPGVPTAEPLIEFARQIAIVPSAPLLNVYPALPSTGPIVRLHGTALNLATGKLDVFSPFARGNVSPQAEPSSLPVSGQYVQGFLVRFFAEPFTWYTFTVALETQAGIGPAWPITVRTLETVPDPPVHVVIRDVASTNRSSTSDNVKVSWRAPPGRPKGNITEYSLFLGPPNDPDQTLVITVASDQLDVILPASALSALEGEGEEDDDDEEDDDEENEEDKEGDDRDSRPAVQLRVRARTGAGTGGFSEPAVDQRRSTRSSSSGSDSNSLSDGAQAGIIVGVLACVCAVVLVLMLLWRRQKRVAESRTFHFPPADDWEVDRARLTRIDRVGAGAFGVVHLGQATKLPHGPRHAGDRILQVAIKECRAVEPHAMQRFVLEAATLKHLSNPGSSSVVALYGVCLQSSPLTLIMEYCNKGDLRRFLIQHRPSEWPEMMLTWVDLAKVARDIARGMKYLSRLGCVHSDLSSRNCLVHVKQDLLITKIGDLGRAHFPTDGSRRSASLLRPNAAVEEAEDRIPVRWMPPEVLKQRGTPRYSEASDVWSFGVCIFEILTFGATPFAHLQIADIKAQIRQGYHPAPPSNAPGPLKRLMLSCFELEPRQRPNFTMLEQRASGNLRSLREAANLSTITEDPEVPTHLMLCTERNTLDSLSNSSQQQLIGTSSVQSIRTASSATDVVQSQFVSSTV